MAVPKRKISRNQKKLRRIHKKLTATSLSVCPQCKEDKLPHRVCPSCGYYDGKEVFKDADEADSEDQAGE